MGGSVPWELPIARPEAQLHTRIFYGWVIVAVGFFIQALGYGTRYSFSVVFPSLLEEFGWTRDVTAAILSFHILAYGITAPIAGTLVDRVGARKTMALGAILLALGTALSGFGNALWHFYLSFGLLTGVGLCLMGSVPLTRIASNWFVARRGLAFSLMFFGSGGAFLLYPVVAFLIDRIGRRGMFLVEASLVLGILLPAILLFIRYHPREKGLFPDGRPEALPERAAGQGKITGDMTWAATDWTLPKAIRTARFWLLCLTAFSVWGVAQHVLVTHHVAFAEGAGYSRFYASSVLSLFGLFMSAGALTASISDRIGRETTITIGTVIGVAGIGVLMLVSDASHPWMLYSYAALFGFGFGLTSPTLPASVTDIFHGRGAGTVIGAVWLAFALGGTIGPWLGGAVYEAAGGYLPAFAVAAAMFVVACIAIWFAAPRHVRHVAGRSPRILAGR